MKPRDHRRAVIGCFVFGIASTVLSGTVVAQQFGTVSYKRATGQFATESPTSHGTLVYRGVLDGGELHATTRLLGQPAVYSIDVAVLADGTVEATVGFDALGAMSYVYRPDGTDELSSLSVSDCGALAQSPLFAAISESAMKMLVVDRRWEVGPDVAEIRKIVESLVLLFSGTKLIDDCRIWFPDDSWGCDGLHWADCGPKGACCDSHDACYEEYGCDASSWYKPWQISCVGCNAMVTACFATPAVFGPSVCCGLGNCGDERTSCAFCF